MKYRLLIRASKHMGTSKNKLMRVLRLKFETCYKLKLGVNNVDTFVDKYVYRHRFCGLLLYTWETISGEFVILCMLSGSVFAVLGLVNECERTDILYTFLTGVLSCAVLITYDFFINLSMKRKVLKTNISDYLENFLKSRLESDESSAELLEQYKKEYFDFPNQLKAKGKKKKEKKQKGAIPLVSGQAETAATVIGAKDAKRASKLEQTPSKPQVQEKAANTVTTAKVIPLNPTESSVNKMTDKNIVRTADKALEHMEERKQDEIVKIDESSKSEDKKDSKKDEGALRREAKKNELKKMILADKEKFSERKQEEVEERISFEKPSNITSKQSVHKNTKQEASVVEKPVKVEVVHKENPVKESISEEAKQEIAVTETRIPDSDIEVIDKKSSVPAYNSISEEEAKIIEDILREFLS